MKLVAVICSVGLILIAALYYFLFDISLDTLDSLLINLFSSITLLFLTLFLLDRLVKRHVETAEEERVKRKYEKLLSIQHQVLTNKLINNFTVMVTSKSSGVSLEHLLEKIDDYVDETFLSRKYIVSSPNPGNIFKFNESHLSYQQFSHRIFKPNVFNSIESHLNRYISIMPQKVVHSLLTIESTIKSNMFVLPEDHGVSFDVSNAEFNPEDIRNELRIIGHELIELRDYVGKI